MAAITVGDEPVQNIQFVMLEVICLMPITSLGAFHGSFDHQRPRKEPKPIAPKANSSWVSIVLLGPYASHSQSFIAHSHTDQHGQ